MDPSAAAKLEIGNRSPCDWKMLQKCLAENNNDMKKCEEEVRNFQSECKQKAAAAAANKS